MHCPSCNGTNIHTITSTNTREEGFNGCLACIGVLLFNWVGLLCGLCGRDVKTNTHTSHICRDCGLRF